MEFRHAIRASQGGRSYQEDSAVIWNRPPATAGVSPLPGETRLLAILADGMGGHAGGAIASAAICSVFEATFLAAAGSVQERLGLSLQEANKAIATITGEQPHLRGMGATLIGVAFSGAEALWISVGDSPLYIYRAGQMARLNEDHSMGPMLDRLVAAGRMTEAESKADPRRHLLRSAVAGEDIELIDLAEDPWKMVADDVMLLASDGIHSIHDQEIARIIAAFRNEGPGAVAEALIKAVDDQGMPHQDNTTVAVVIASG